MNNRLCIAVSMASLALLGVPLVAQEPPPVAVQAGPMDLPVNQWTRIGDVPPDPLARELEPGRGSYWCFEPESALFIRYGGYTPTENNDLWTYSLPARRWENPLKADYSWPPPTNRPGAGPWWSMAYDSRRKVIWFHGGEGVAGRDHKDLYQDTWQYNPATKALTPMKAKAWPRYGARIVYDSKNDLIIRAPAYDGEWSAMHNRDQTWIYDPAGNAWEGRKTPGSPKAVLAGAFVFDPGAGKAVYLAHDKAHVVATWTYDAATNKWEKLETAVKPPARVVAGITYDPLNKAVILCGGVGGKEGGYGYLHRGGGVPLTDTWALDVTKAEWRKLDVGAPVIPKLTGQTGVRFEFFQAMDYDSRNQAIILSGPTIGVWALRIQPAGSKAAPPLKLAAVPAFAPAAPSKEPLFKMAPPNPALLALEENTWTRINNGGGAGGGEVPATYDEATGFLLKFGGCNDGGTTFASGYGNDLWAYDPADNRWIALRPTDPCGPPRPQNGCTRNYAYDPVRKVTWFAGGTSGNSLSSSLPAGWSGSGTWCYDGLKDRYELIPSTGKAGGTGTVCCYDRANNVFLCDPKEVWATKNVCVFDPEKKAWSAGAAAPGYEYNFGCYVDSLKVLMAVKPGKAGSKHVAYDAATAQWRDLEPRGELPSGGRPTLACDPDNDIVLCAIGGKTFVYVVKDNTWKTLATRGESPKLDEKLIFDRRHKVFLGAQHNGQVWAYRYKKAD